jgi:hypothetical protein
MKNCKTQRLLMTFMLFTITVFSQKGKSKLDQNSLNEKQVIVNELVKDCQLGYIKVDKNCNLRVETNQGIEKRWTPLTLKPSKDAYPIKDGMVGNKKILLNLDEVNQIRFVNDKPVLYCLAISYQIDAQQVISIPLILEKGVALLTTDLVTITTIRKGKITLQSIPNTAFQQNDYIGHVTLLR